MENTAPDEITPVGKSIRLFIQRGLDRSHRAAGFSQSPAEQGGNDDLYDSSIPFINQDDGSIALGAFQVQMNFQTKERQLETAWAAKKKTNQEGEKDDALLKAMQEGPCRSLGLTVPCTSIGLWTSLAHKVN